MSSHNKLLLLLILLIGYSCSHYRGEEIIEELQRVDIPLDNYEEFKIQNSKVIIGSHRKTYHKGETATIHVRNLPLENYKIRINGSYNGIIDSTGNWSITRKANYYGRKINVIQVFDSINNVVIEHEVEFNVTSAKPNIQTKYGRNLIKGIYNELEISNLDLICPTVKLEIKGGELRKGNRNYEIKPFLNSDSVEINIKYIGMNHTVILDAIDPLFPRLEINSIHGNKCYSLESHEILGDYKYHIEKIILNSKISNKKIEIIDSNCLEFNGDYEPIQILYRFHDSIDIDTLVIN